MLRDIKTIMHMLKTENGKSHAERLENFYHQQADNYDEFRQKLLPGRQKMIEQVSPLARGSWVDLGCGTASNLSFMGEEKAISFDSIDLVDLSPSLLAKANERVDQMGLQHVHFHQKDVCEFPGEEVADLVTFSYSLTMIPQWFRAIDRAYKLLKKGGYIGVVDFYVSAKHPQQGMRNHSAWTRSFWPLWFSWDNVRLNPDHIPYLQDKFDEVELFEGVNGVPYAPFGKVPYYYFIGQKPMNH